MGFHALCLLHLNKFKNFRFYKYQLQILQFGHQISRWNRASVCVYIWVVFGSLVGSCQLFCGESSHLHELFSKTVKKTWNNDDLKGFFHHFLKFSLNKWKILLDFELVSWKYWRMLQSFTFMWKSGSILLYMVAIHSTSEAWKKIKKRQKKNNNDPGHIHWTFQSSIWCYWH